METDTKLNYFKKKILTHLEELQRKERNKIKKSLLPLEELNKSALPLEQAKDFYVDTKSGSFVLVEEYGMKKNKQCRNILVFAKDPKTESVILHKTFYDSTSKIPTKYKKINLVGNQQGFTSEEDEHPSIGRSEENTPAPASGSYNISGRSDTLLSAENDKKSSDVLFADDPKEWLPLAEKILKIMNKDIKYSNYREIESKIPSLEKEIDIANLNPKTKQAIEEALGTIKYNVEKYKEDNFIKSNPFNLWKKCEMSASTEYVYF